MLQLSTHEIVVIVEPETGLVGVLQGGSRRVAPSLADILVRIEEEDPGGGERLVEKDVVALLRIVPVPHE